jgi:hypothetical protein
MYPQPDQSNEPKRKELTRQDLRRIALLQKGLLLCVLAYAFALLLNFGVLFDGLNISLNRVVFAGATLLGVVFVFMLSIKLYGIVIGVILGLLTLVPLLGLLILLVINSKATNTLKAFGIPVGLMGADHTLI